jgi:hypothetical protein
MSKINVLDGLPRLIYLQGKDKEIELIKDLNSQNIWLIDITRHICNKTKQEMKKTYNFKGRTYYYVLEMENQTGNMWIQNKSIKYKRDNTTPHPYGTVYIINVAKCPHMKSTAKIQKESVVKIENWWYNIPVAKVEKYHSAKYGLRHPCGNEYCEICY